MRVYQVLRAEIAAGVFAPGARLPSETDLATSFGVSRVTVREALRMLQREGLVVARHGRGHFVLNTAPIREPITELRGVTELLASLGYEVETEVLEVAQLAAGRFSEQLRVDSDEPVVHIERLRRSGGDPLIYSVDIVPLRVLGEAEIDYSGSLLHLLSLRGFELAYSHAKIRAAPLPEKIRRRLGTAAREPWLLLDQVNYSAEDTPLIVSLDYHRGDRFEFNVLRRRPG